MSKSSPIALAISLAGLVLFWPAQARPEDQILRLSLAECIQKTLKNNLGLAADLLTPEMASASLAVAGQKFIPSLVMNYGQQDNRSASFSFLDTAGAAVSTAQNEYSFQVAQTLPTGGSLTLGLTGYKTDTTRQFQTINPRFGSTLRFSFSQPLLKDFGWRVSRREVLLARNNRDISELNLSQAVEDVIYRAKSAYWSLVYSLENLEVRRRSLKLARELLDKTKAEVEAGTMPPIEILTAQADVSTREADILEAEAMVRNSEDLIRTYMNLEAEIPGAASVHIVPTDSPEVAEHVVSLEEALAAAMLHRPDLQAAKVGLSSKQLNVGFARNQLFPDLRLQASYWSPGISGTQILYEGGNALTGKVIGIVPGGGDQALKDAMDFKYKNWSVGLSLTFPMNMIFSREAYVLAKLDLDQNLLRLRNQEQQVFLEIRTAVRSVETNYRRIQAYRAARENATKKLEAEEEKLKVGLSTNYFVLQYQRDLASAMISELKSTVDYNISLAALDRSQGRGMEHENISLLDVGPAAKSKGK
ncbi:MAG: TolC family protein [Candidatus Aminicenantes bacterium]|nr:TolC family protein [Candidatus Aminicenantes bacterium]